MYHNIATFLGGLIILYGLILLTRNKFMISRKYDAIFIFIMATLNPSIELIKMGYEFLILLFDCVILIVLLAISNERYTLTNVNSQMVSNTLTDILKENDIVFEDDDDAIVLKDYDDKRIIYQQSLNSVEVNFKEIRKLPFYNDLKKELKYRIRINSIKLFPSTGVFLIVIGVTFIIILQYLGK